MAHKAYMKPVRKSSKPAPNTNETEPSSIIAYHEYDEMHKTLTVELTNGNAYQYNAVPKNINDDFIGSPSKGAFYNKNIKTKYKCQKL